MERESEVMVLDVLFRPQDMRNNKAKYPVLNKGETFFFICLLSVSQDTSFYPVEASEKLNSLPSPIWLFTQIFPPWASINSFEMASPRPVLERSWEPGTLK